MTFGRMLPILVVCAAVAWLAGPVGRFVVALPLLLFGPGYLLDRALGVSLPGAFARPALWLGLSLSLVALLYEWATVLGFALTASVLHLLALTCAVGVVLAVRGQGSAANSPLHPLTPSPLHLVLLSIVFVLALWLRFVQIENLALPNWVDSVHHALMVRVAVETGLAPISLRPYMPVDQLPYHWGYHVFIAWLVQLCGLPIPPVMLWSGQVLNALHVLAGAAFAATCWRRPTAGIVAGAVIGLVSMMPAYYVSWGRYTQLSGLLLLPPLAIVWRAGLHTGLRRWWLHAAVLLAGLSLIHFRILVFALALLAVITTVWAVQAGWPPRWSSLREITLAGGLSLLLAGPWMALLVSRRLVPIAARPQALVSEGGYAALNIGLLWAGQNQLLVALALAAALWGLRCRSSVAVEQVGWVAGMFVLANPFLASYTLPAVGGALLVNGLQQRRWALLLAGVPLLLINPWLVRLPASWLITNDVVAITLFLPLAVLIGGLARILDFGFSISDWAAQAKIQNPKSKIAQAVLILALVAYVGWSAWQLRDIVNDSTVLATEADVTAIAWVAANTSPDARFLINAAGWLPTADRGTDGGWWLLPLTARWTSTPPVIADYGAYDYVQRVRQINKTVVSYQPGNEAVINELIDREAITHIYLGVKPGPLTPATFANNPRFETVYEQHGVIILAVRR